MNIAAIMPCRGRHEQTVINIRRLIATAGYDTWRLIAVGGKDDHTLLDSLASFGIEVIRSDQPRVTYWQALAGATQHTNATHLVNLANDLLPGQHWLRRAVEAYREMFLEGVGIDGDGAPGVGLLGFNGDSHEVGHSCHFLISRALLEHYGGWPIWYDHNFGDAELCQRAIADGLYAKAPWALLYHDHPYWGGQDDTVYAEGRALVDKDAAIFEQRRRAGWPDVRATNASVRPIADTSAARSAVPSIARI